MKAVMNWSACPMSEFKEELRRMPPQKLFFEAEFDLFDETVPTAAITKVLDICAAIPKHDYTFITRNAHRMLDIDYLALLPQTDNFHFCAEIHKGRFAENGE